MLQAMMDFKICLFINQYLTHQNIKTRVLEILLVGNQTNYISIGLNSKVLPNIKCLKTTNVV